MLVVTDSGDAALVTSVPAAPAGKTYEVWVFEGETPRPAGTFEGTDAHDVVRLTRQVPPGADDRGHGRGRRRGRRPDLAARDERRT